MNRRDFLKTAFGATVATKIQTEESDSDAGRQPDSAGNNRAENEPAAAR